MLKYVITVAGGIAVGIVIGSIMEKSIMQIRENKKNERSRILEECFGKPMYASKFSMNEVRGWIKSRKERLESGAKAVILKVNAETLKQIGKDLDIGNEMEKNMVIAIIDETTKNIEDSVLIKYEVLDANLEAALEKGKGVLVVEA